MFSHFQFELQNVVKYPNNHFMKNTFEVQTVTTYILQKQLFI